MWYVHPRLTQRGDALEYVLTFTGAPKLEAGATRETVSEECRFAALELMAGAAKGWDKLDLVLWLTGPYHRATRHVPRGERTALIAPSARRLAFGETSGQVDEDGEVEPEAIEDLIVRVRQQLVASLEKAALDEGVLDFADDALARGIVRKTKDEAGEEVWVPVDVSRMRLRDRLRSLFAADYLNTPEAYIELFVCHRCEAVVFDEGAKRLGICGAHKRISGMVPREDGSSTPSTPKVVGDDD